MEKLKIESGKFYRTSGNLKALCVGQLKDGRFVFECLNDMPRNKDQIIFGDQDGKTAANDSWQIVAEWKEPKRIHGFINIYRGGEAIGGLRDTKEEANERALKGRIACIEIEVLEGQGLDGSAQ
ncbi:hypothetical protein ACVIHC_002218 [Bradyrhizobium diazoefficiens]